VRGSPGRPAVENLAHRHDPDLDLAAILDHLAGVSVFADEDFAGYGLDEPRIADLRSWVTGWYDDLARHITAGSLTMNFRTTCDGVRDLKSAPAVQSQVDYVCHYRLHGGLWKRLQI
jgi:hypothetical protein